MASQFLIVEDELLIAWTLADMLRDLGHSVSGIVATQRDAVAGAAGCDAILMDFQLAEGDGLAAARLIRQQSDIPIVFCTAYASDAAFAGRMSAVERSALIGKPILAAELKAALAQVLGVDPRT